MERREADGTLRGLLYEIGVTACKSGLALLVQSTAAALSATDVRNCTFGPIEHEVE